MSIVTRSLGVVLIGAVGIGLARLSTSDLRVSKSPDAVLRISMGARPERIEVCREQSNEELEKVLPQMRQRLLCEGTTARYRLEVRRSDLLLLSQDVRGGGLRHDRQLYVYRELPLPPGPSSIAVRFVRLDTVVAGTTDEREHRDEGERPDEGERRDEGKRREDSQGIAPDRARREVEERRRRRGEAIPAALHLDTIITLAPREVVLLTYSPEDRRLLFAAAKP